MELSIAKTGTNWIAIIIIIKDSNPISLPNIKVVYQDNEVNYIYPTTLETFIYFRYDYSAASFGFH